MHPTNKEIAVSFIHHPFQQPNSFGNTVDISRRWIHQKGISSIRKRGRNCPTLDGSPYVLLWHSITHSNAACRITVKKQGELHSKCACTEHSSCKLHIIIINNNTPSKLEASNTTLAQLKPVSTNNHVIFCIRLLEKEDWKRRIYPSSSHPPSFHMVHS